MKFLRTVGPWFKLLLSKNGIVLYSHQHAWECLPLDRLLFTLKLSAVNDLIFSCISLCCLLALHIFSLFYICILTLCFFSVFFLNDLYELWKIRKLVVLFLQSFIMPSSCHLNFISERFRWSCDKELGGSALLWIIDC